MSAAYPADGWVALILTAASLLALAYIARIYLDYRREEQQQRRASAERRRSALAARSRRLAAIEAARARCREEALEDAHLRLHEEEMRGAR